MMLEEKLELKNIIVISVILLTSILLRLHSHPFLSTTVLIIVANSSFVLGHNANLLLLTDLVYNESS